MSTDNYDIKGTEEGQSLNQITPRAMAASTGPETPVFPPSLTGTDIPVMDNQLNEEAVIPATGNLQYTVTDYTLAGRNGFDLVFKRQYNSEEAVNRTMIAKLMADNTYYTSWVTNIYGTDSSSLGKGWRLGQPAIEVLYNSKLEWKNSQWVNSYEYQYFYYSPDNQKIEIYDGPLGGYFKVYPFKNISYHRATGSITHPVTRESAAYHCYVKHDNGETEYFAKQYSTDIWGVSYTASIRLVARQDKYGNVVFFSYTGFGSGHITDSWGRKITVDRSSSRTIFTLPSDQGRQVKLQYNHPNWALTGYVNPNNETTSYSYHSGSQYEVLSLYADGAKKSPSNPDYKFAFSLLKEITTPTGGRTLFEYGDGAAGRPLKLSLNDLGGYWQYFPLLSRKEVGESMEYNRQTYSYTLPASRSYISQTVAKKEDAISEKYIFNSKRLATSKEVSHNSSLIQKVTYSYGLAANNTNLPISEVDERCGVYKKQSAWTYSADQMARISRVSVTYSAESAAANYSQSFTYGSYGMLVQKNHQDSRYTILEEYTPDASGKNIKTARVWHNGVLKKRTEYLYNTENCIAEQRSYYAGPGEDLAGSTRYAVTLFGYDAAQFVHMPTAQTLCSIVDADGQPQANIVSRFRYDQCGRVLQETNGRNHTTTYVYDNLGRLLQATLPACAAGSAKTTYAYNRAENSATVTDALGAVTKTVYTSFGKPARVFLVNSPTGGQFLSHEFAYDTSQRLVSEKLYGGQGVKRTNLYSYDYLSRITRTAIPETGFEELSTFQDAVTMPNGHKGYGRTVITRDSASDVQTKKTFLSDQLENILYEYAGDTLKASNTYDAQGNVTVSVDAKGTSSRYEYDCEGRLLRTTEDVGGLARTTANQYDSLGNLCRVTDALGNQSAFEYDFLGRQIKQTSPFDIRSQVVKSYYDECDNLVKQCVLASDGWKETQHSYDAVNRPVSACVYLTAGKGEWNKTVTRYDIAGNVVETQTGLSHSNTTGTSVFYHYNRYGKPVEFTDAMGNKETFTYTVDGLLAQKTERTGTVVKYGYDALDRLVQETCESPAGRSVKQLRYNAANQLLQESLEESGQTGAHSNTVRYSYDAEGNLAEQTDAEGIIKRYVYDANGNRIQFSLFKPDERNRQYACTATQYDALGPTAQAYDGKALTVKQFDENGLRLLSSGATPSTAAQPQGLLRAIELKYSYDALNRLVEVTGHTRAQAVVKYRYDALGNTVRVELPHANIVMDYTFNKAGCPVEMAVAENGAARKKEVYEYDVDGACCAKMQIENLQGALTAQDYGALALTAAQYDARGLEAAEYDINGAFILTGASAARPNTYSCFSYDAMGRLTGETSSAGYTCAYTYDSRSNRVHMVRREAGVGQETSCEYDANNKLIRQTVQVGNTQAGSRFTYDANGNLLETESNGSVKERRAYNLRNQLVSFSRGSAVTKYAYYANGLRMGKINGQGIFDTRHIWDGSNLVADCHPQMQDEIYVHGKGPVAKIVDDVLTMQYIQNAFGSIVGQKNAQALVPLRYDAFGSLLQAALPGEVFLYNAEYWDAESDTYYIRARYYSPALGRWLAEDPSRHGANWYGYCYENPVNFRDPSGRIGLLAVIGISAGVTALFGGLGAYFNNENVLAGIAGGAVAGAAGAFFPGYLGFLGGSAVQVGMVSVLSGTLFSGFNAAVQGKINNNTNEKSIFYSALFGGVSAGLGGLLFSGPATALNEATNAVLWESLALGGGMAGNIFYSYKSRGFYKKHTIKLRINGAMVPTNVFLPIPPAPPRITISIPKITVPKYQVTIPEVPNFTFTPPPQIEIPKLIPQITFPSFSYVFDLLSPFNKLLSK